MALTTFVKACERHTPGVKELWLGLASAFTNGVIGSNEVTDIDTTQVVFTLAPDSVQVTQNGVGTKDGLFYVEKTIEFHVNKLEDTVTKMLMDLADSSACGITAIYKTNNNQWFCSGFEISNVAKTELSASRGLYFAEGNTDTGKEANTEDGDQAVVMLKGTFPQYDFVVDDTTAITVDASGVEVAA